MLNYEVAGKMNGIEWKLKDRRAVDLLRFIPTFLSAKDSRPAKEQIEENYAHGGGWRSMDGWKFNRVDGVLSYGEGEDEERYEPVAEAMVNNEVVMVYPLAWVCILQQDGSFEVARMD